MARNNKDEENDNLDGVESSTGLLGSNEMEKEEDLPFCGWLSIRYYQPYFDVDTSDVFSRITNSTIYCGRQESFLTLIGDKPDLYGPFWVSTTLVFTIAVCSHISSWISSWMIGINWEYDFQSIVNASSLVYGFAGLAPALIYISLRQMDVNIKLINTICLYGYSLFVFVVAGIFCLMPSNAAIWISLLIASTTSSIFLIRNLAPLVIASAPESLQTVSLGIGFIQLLFTLLLKFLVFD